MAVTARAICVKKTEFHGADQATFEFGPDYQNGANKEWAAATPSLQVIISVKDRDLFNVGGKVTLTFEPSED